MTFDSPSIVAIVGLLATIVGFIYTWFKDARERKWAREDSLDVRARLDAQDKAIADGTTNAKAAYSEANSVNAKIANLHEDIRVIKKNGSGH